MRVLIVAILVVFANVLLFSHEHIPLPDLGGQVIYAVTSNDYPPLSMVDVETGKSVGFEYDLTNMIAARLNAVIDWNLSSWETMIASVRAGEYDVGMDGITITEEREKIIDFSVPYLTSEQFMLVRADEKRFTDAESFSKNESFLVGAIPGTTNFYTAVYNVLDGNEDNPRIQLFNSFGTLVQSLIAGDVDVVLMDAASSRGYIGVHPDKLKVIGGPLGSEQFGYIFTPDSPYVEYFNEALLALQEEGTLERLVNYWFFTHTFSQ